MLHVQIVKDRKQTSDNMIVFSFNKINTTSLQKANSFTWEIHRQLYHISNIWPYIIRILQFG